jgi:hypothetical protein
LQEKYNVQIGYDTIWHGKENAMADMYGTWQENFQQLLNWKALCHVEEEPTLGSLDMVLHEQGPIVIEEEEVVNICTPKKTMKRAVRKLTPKKKLDSSELMNDVVLFCSTMLFYSEPMN